MQVGLDVLTGWLRFAVAKLTPAARYTIDSPIMTVGMRGTEGVIQVGMDTGDFALDEGAVDITAPDDVRAQRALVVAGPGPRHDLYRVCRSGCARICSAVCRCCAGTVCRHK